MFQKGDLNECWLAPITIHVSVQLETVLHHVCRNEAIVLFRWNSEGLSDIEIWPTDILVFKAARIVHKIAVKKVFRVKMASFSNLVLNL